MYSVDALDEHAAALREILEKETGRASAPGVAEVAVASGFALRRTNIAISAAYLFGEPWSSGRAFDSLVGHAGLAPRPAASIALAFERDRIERPGLLRTTLTLSTQREVV